MKSTEEIYRIVDIIKALPKADLDRIYYKTINTKRYKGLFNFRIKYIKKEDYDMGTEQVVSLLEEIPNKKKFLDVLNKYKRKRKIIIKKKKTNLIENEAGEEISKEELVKITRKIRELSLKDIDMFWYNLGWVETGRNGKNNSLSNASILGIKLSQRRAEGYVESLFNETPKKDFLKAINKIKGKKLK